MVDLNTDVPDVVAQTPQARVSSFQYARAGSFLAQGLDKLSDGLNDIAVPMAKDQAAQDLQNGSAVSRDAQGNIQVGKPPGMPILGPAGEVYAHTVAAGQLAQGDNLATQDVAGLRAANEGNPQGFLQAGNDYVQNTIARNPGPSGQAIADRAQSLVSQHYSGMVQQQAQSDVANSKQQIVDARSNAFNELSGLALGGATSGPEWDRAQSNWAATGHQLVANPAFGVSQGVQDANDKADLANLHGYAIAGNVDRDMKGPGGIEAAMKNLQSGVSDPGLDMSPADRQKMMAIGEARIKFNQGANESDIRGLHAGIEALRSDVLSGRTPPPPAAIVEAIHQKAMSLGDTEATKQIEGLQRTWEYDAAKKGLTPSQQLDAQGIGRGSTPPAACQGAPAGAGLSPQQSAVQQGVAPAGAPPGAVAYNPTTGAYLTPATQNRDGSPAPPIATAPGVAADAAAGNANIAARTDLSTLDGYKARVAQIESGGNPNAVSPTGAVGKYQFLPSTLKTFGGVIGGDQEGAMNALTARNQVTLTQGLGRAPTPGELYLAHQQGAGGATQLLQHPTERAGDLVGDQAIRVNGGDPNASAATFTNMWVQKFEGGAPAPAMAPSANGFPFTPQQVSDNPFLLSSWVRAQASDPENRAAFGERLGGSIVQRVLNGSVPPINDVAMFSQLAGGNPRLADTSQKVQAALAAEKINQGLINLPPGQADLALATVKNAANGADMYHFLVADYAQKLHASETEQLQKSPQDYAVSKGWATVPNPLNVDDPNALAKGLLQRSDIMDHVTGHGVASPEASALSKIDAQQLRDTIAGGTGQQIQNITSALGYVSQSRRDATIAELGPAIIGAANSGDPGKMKAAYGFLGQQFDTNPVDFRKDFGKDAAGQLLAYRNALVFLPPDVAAKRVQGWSDPSQEETRSGVGDAAKDELKGVTADQVAQKFSTLSYVKPWTWDGVRAQTPTTDAAATSGEGLHADYSDAYIKQRQLGMDAAHADANATAILQTKWGVSGVNGNMVMPYPPESKYPAVGGSHAWISEQLDRDVFDATGVAANHQTGIARYGDATAEQRRAALAGNAPWDPDDTPKQMGSVATYLAPRAIASDSTTEADIAAGKPPSYYVVTQDAAGLWNPLTNSGGALVRFRPDPQAVPSVAATHAPGFTTGNGERLGRARIIAGPHDFISPPASQGP